MHRFHDSDLDEKERQDGENCGLDESHEDLEQHEGHRPYVGYEVCCDEDEYFASDDIAKKTEGKGNEARDLRKKLDNADNESNDRMRIDEFGCVFEKAKYGHPGNLDNDERDDGECESDVEVGVDTAQERGEPVLSKKTDTANARCEFEHVGSENEKKKCHDQRKEATRMRATSERFCNVVVHESEEPLQERLKPSGHHFEPAPDDECKYDEKKDDDPAGQERIGDGKPKPFSQLFGREGDVNSLFHGRDFSTLRPLYPSAYCALNQFFITSVTLLYSL